MRSFGSSTPRLHVAEPATRNAGPQQTLQQCVARAARVGRSDRDGLYWLDRKERETHCSWQLLADRAARSGATLQRAGVVPGDRVALCIPTEPGFGDALLGCYALSVGGGGSDGEIGWRLGEDYHQCNSDLEYVSYDAPAGRG